MMLALFWQVYLPFGFLFCEKSVHVFCSLKKKKGFSFPYWFTRVLEIFWIQALHWYLYSNYRLPLCGLHFHRLNGVFWWTEALNFIEQLMNYFLLSKWLFFQSSCQRQEMIFLHSSNLMGLLGVKICESIGNPLKLQLQGVFPSWRGPHSDSRNSSKLTFNC